MRRRTGRSGRLRRQHGQVLPLVAIGLVAFIGLAAMVLDIGRLYLAQQQLQTAVDAAALAAGQDLPDASTAYSTAITFSAAAGDKNAISGYGVTANAAKVTFQCVSHAPDYTAGSTPTCPTDTSGDNCHPTGAQTPTPSGATTCNAVNITESATVKTTLAGLFLPSFTLSASSTASARGGQTHPVNAYVILDTTDSMGDSCSGTVTGISNPDRLDCAKAGMRALLGALWPCDQEKASCGSDVSGNNVASPVDEVGLEVFPAISGNPPSSSTLGDETDCNSRDSFSVTYPTYSSYTYRSSSTDGGIPSGDDYSGYEAIGLSSDFRSSDTATTLTTTSPLVEAVDWEARCANASYPGGDYYGLKDIGGQGSYLAGAITEAQHLLNANDRNGAQNAIIIESDGQLNNPKTFTDNNPCASAISAANQAKAAGTTIYSIAYGANGTSCPDKSDSYTDTSTMQSIASNASTFFNSPTTGDLTADFQQVGTDLTGSRLIPDCTQAPPYC